MFDIWCVVCILKESSKLAGWQAWLAGRLLRSAVMVFAPMKQYGHVPYLVGWLEPLDLDRIGLSTYDDFLAPN